MSPCRLTLRFGFFFSFPHDWWNTYSPFTPIAFVSYPFIRLFTLSEPSFGLRFAMGGRISIFLIRIMGVSFGAGLASGLIVFAPALLPFSSVFSEGQNSVAESFGCPASICILAVLSRRFSPGESTLTRGVDNCNPGNSLKAHPTHLKCKRGGE